MGNTIDLKLAEDSTITRKFLLRTIQENIKNINDELFHKWENLIYKNSIKYIAQHKWRKYAIFISIVNRQLLHNELSRKLLWLSHKYNIKYFYYETEEIRQRNNSYVYRCLNRWNIYLDFIK